ncbi:TPA_asm: maturation protein [ssRNA phage SRR7976301_6]|uniref:Maturation protein n=1 Tax=ssRNA phage SRR7976301_6 TaxID=2786667 RepID=A0A8S5L4Q7_9VIRU|nr:maturation protein [ssRNA phage SRR7976301_6]DAD52680.1 TPA_asm: maturation protein [ssRNA phage SRR7976301_6]
MKSRSTVHRLQRTIIRGGPAGVSSEVTDYPNYRYDTLNVIQDYVGPKNTAIEHNHQFVKSYICDYNGAYHSTSPGGNYTDQYGYIAAFTRHSSPGGAFAPSYIMSTVYNNALEDLYGNLRGTVDLSVSAAEWRQTRNMFIQNFDHLKPMAEKLERQIPRALRFLLSFDYAQWPKRWLEYSYGWRPLIQDIYGTVDEMRKAVVYGHVRVEGKAWDTDHRIKTYDGTMPLSKEVVNSITKQRCKIVAEFKIQQSALNSLSNFTSINPASIAWELMPYSFVVDWFYDIGGYVRNMESCLLFCNSLVKAYSVEGYKARFDGTLSGGGVQSLVGHAVSATAYAEYSFKRRTVNISLIPRAPDLRANLGWRRLLSAASLLALHLKGVKNSSMGPT